MYYCLITKFYNVKFLQTCLDFYNLFTKYPIQNINLSLQNIIIGTNYQEDYIKVKVKSITNNIICNSIHYYDY